MLSFVMDVSLAFLLSLSILNCVDSSVYNYNEIRDLGATFYPRDSCQYGHHRKTQPKDEGKSCECDATCYRRGTCCIDSPYAEPRSSASKEICSGETIMGVHQRFYFEYLNFNRKSHSFFQIVKCDSNWKGSIRVRQLCEVEEPFRGADFMAAVPVTNIRSNITYKNYFCALCNDDLQGSVLWDFSIYEADGSEYDISGRLIVQAANETYDGTRDSIVSSRTCSNESALALVFNSVQGIYGTWDYCSDNPRGFAPVTVTLSIPEKIKHLVKGCRPELISCCLPNWTDVRVKVLCESYFGIIKESPRVDEYGTYHEQYFRNAHCALCNNVTDFEGYFSEPFSVTPVLTPSYPTSETILFHRLLPYSECLGDREEDTQGLSCRAGICRNPLHKVEDGKCTP